MITPGQISDYFSINRFLISTIFKIFEVHFEKYISCFFQILEILQKLEPARTSIDGLPLPISSTSSSTFNASESARSSSLSPSSTLRRFCFRSRCRRASTTSGTMTRPSSSVANRFLQMIKGRTFNTTETWTHDLGVNFNKCEFVKTCLFWICEINSRNY